MPEIKIESVLFDENDGWMSSLLNNSVEFEESVKEIEKELEIEKLGVVNQENNEKSRPMSKIVEPIVEAISVTTIKEQKQTQKAKKSVSFGVSYLKKGPELNTDCFYFRLRGWVA